MDTAIDDDKFDVFVSYSSKDSESAGLLVAGLQQLGFKVWHDRSQISDFDPIADKLKRGIEQSRVVIALGSENHSRSPVCRWEMLYALRLGAVESCERLRIVVLDPRALLLYEAGETSHRATEWDGAPHSLPRVLGVIVREVHRLAPHGARDGSPAERPIVGLPGKAGTRFTGRYGDLLRLESLLLGPMSRPNVGDPQHQRLVVVSGLGGIGKSLLTIFFVEQFAAAFQNGALWLGAGGDRVDGSAVDLHEQDQIYDSLSKGAIAWLRHHWKARGLDEPTLPTALPEKWRVLRDQIGALMAGGGNQLLLVIDDAPAGMSFNDLIPRADGVAVIVTTQDRSLVGEGDHRIDLDQLHPSESLALLTRALDPEGKQRRAGVDPWSGREGLARELASRVQHHPMALDLLGLRLAEHERLEDLVQEVMDGDDDFLDEAGGSLPGGHRRSISATVSGALRAAARGRAWDINRAVRAISVVPAGTQIAPEFMRHLLEGRPKRHEVVNRLVHLGLFRRTPDGSSLSAHALVRAVALRLWRDEKPPFATDRPVEPDLTGWVALWFRNSGARRLNTDDVAAAQDYFICSEVMAQVGNELDVEARKALCEAYVARARVVYRSPDRSSPQDYAQALRWVDEAQRALVPVQQDEAAQLHWSNAEAMRGLLLGAMFSERIQPDLPPRERLQGLGHSLKACRTVYRKRRQLLASLSLQEGVGNALHAAKDALARGAFNLTERGLEVARALVANGGPDAVKRADRQLREVELRNQEALQLRRALWPQPNDGQRLAIASSYDMEAAIAYHRAVLFRRPAKERLELLASAEVSARRGLDLRRDHEVDVTKSAKLLLKIAVGSLALQLSDAQSWVMDASETACREAEGLQAAGASERWRELLIRVEGQSPEGLVEPTMHFQELATWCLDLLWLANVREVRGETSERVIAELFGTPASRGDIERLMSPP